MRLPLPSPAGSRLFRVACAWGAVSIPYLAQAQAGTPTAFDALSARVVRLELPGTVSLRRADIAAVSVTATAKLRGYTIGSSNATQRAPYRTESVRIADTLIVRPAPRERLRSVGLTWRHEHFDHELWLPADATVIVHGASQLSVDGAISPRCARRAWIVAPGSGPRCLAEANL